MFAYFEDCYSAINLLTTATSVLLYFQFSTGLAVSNIQANENMWKPFAERSNTSHRTYERETVEAFSFSDPFYTCGRNKRSGKKSQDFSPRTLNRVIRTATYTSKSWRNPCDVCRRKVGGEWVPLGAVCYCAPTPPPPPSVAAVPRDYAAPPSLLNNR